MPGPGVVRGVTYFENEWNFWLYPGAQVSNLPARPNVQASSLIQTGVPKQASRLGWRRHHSFPVDTSGPARWKPALPQTCPLARVTDVLVTSSWDEAETKLAAGGKVLLVPRNSDLDWTSPPLDRVPVFWNSLMGPAWGRMLGLWIDRKPGETKGHALDRFPTTWHFDWQWAQIIGNVRAVNLDRLPPDLEPVVWAIDDWNRNYKLGLIFECTVGRRPAARLGDRCNKTRLTRIPSRDNCVARCSTT